MQAATLTQEIWKSLRPGADALSAGRAKEYHNPPCGARWVLQAHLHFSFYVFGNNHDNFQEQHDPAGTP